MKGFRETIQKAIPGARFVNTEANAINTSYDPGKTFDAYRAFLSAHPEVQFIENLDIGAEWRGRILDVGQRQDRGFEASKTVLLDKASRRLVCWGMSMLWAAVP